MSIIHKIEKIKTFKNILKLYIPKSNFKKCELKNILDEFIKNATDGKIKQFEPFESNKLRCFEKMENKAIIEKVNCKYVSVSESRTVIEIQSVKIKNIFEPGYHIIVLNEHGIHGNYKKFQLKKYYKNISKEDDIQEKVKENLEKLSLSDFPLGDADEIGHAKFK